MCLLLLVLSIVLMQLGVGSPAVANASALFGSSIWREPANEPWPDAIARHDAMFGPLQVIRIFFGGAPKPWTAPELSHSRPVVVSFKISPREVLEGRHDDTMRAWFAAAPRNRTVWWVYWHEPEDNIAKGEFTAADYRAAFTRLDGLANQASNPMLRTTQVLMDWTLDSRSHRNWRDYYPGANVIDVQAWDQYGYASEPGCAHESMAAHEARVPAYQTTVAEGNDYAIAEIGSICIPQRAAWLRDVCAWGSSRAVFVTYFHSFGPLGDYRLNDPASREAWKSCKPGPDPTRAVDFDGDGLTDRAVYRPAATTGTWHVLQSATNSSTQRAYGARDDIPVAGDYEGDGRLNYALWRPPNGTWYILLADGSTRDVAFGQAGDIPVPGDYDGDRKTDVAVWRPSNGTWYVQRSSDGRIVTKAWGQNGDKPVLGDFDGDKKTDLRSGDRRRATGTSSTAAPAAANTTPLVLPKTNRFPAITTAMRAPTSRSGDRPTARGTCGTATTDRSCCRHSGSKATYRFPPTTTAIRGPITRSGDRPTARGTSSTAAAASLSPGSSARPATNRSLSRALLKPSPRQDGAVRVAALSDGWRTVVGAGASAWVAGVGPVEPHTEVADHDRE